MTSDWNTTHDAADARWKRFNDEFFSVNADPGASPDALVRGLAEEGIELIVDARPDPDRESTAMKAGCEQAGLYYVPADTTSDVSDETISRYANLALRHKTCVVVEEGAHGILAAIAGKRSIKATPIDAGPGPAS